MNIVSIRHLKGFIHKLLRRKDHRGEGMSHNSPDIKLFIDSPEQARFRLFDSIAAFLKTASQRQPLMLVLDDLHWADQPSLMLLQFVARELGGGRLL